MSRSPDVDETAWRADVERELGLTIADWPGYRDVWLDMCDDDDDSFGTFVAVSLDNGDSIDSICTNVRHACPDKLAKIEDMRDFSAEVDEACALPASERTQEQADIAEFMGC
jgi:hypothetical protein